MLWYTYAMLCYAMLCYAMSGAMPHQAWCYLYAMLRQATPGAYPCCAPCYVHSIVCFAGLACHGTAKTYLRSWPLYLRFQFVVSPTRYCISINPWSVFMALLNLELNIRRVALFVKRWIRFYMQRIQASSIWINIFHLRYCCNANAYKEENEGE